MLKQLAKITRGRLQIIDDFGTTTVGRRDAAEIDAMVRVTDPRFYRFAALGGGLGAGEAYMLGYWRTNDLTAVIRLLSRNRHVLEAMQGGWATITRPAAKFFSWLHRNTRRGSRRNIAAHYDLGNDFFALFLDETMTYSSGVFETPHASLAEASAAKYDRFCRKLHLRPNDHVLEIGTGWGGFAQHAAANYGCRVTTTTISKQQHEYARRRIAEAGLDDRVELLCRDYRDLEGQFDKLVSIEMIEAVGHEYLPTFFGKCSDLLRPDGMMALQAITIPDQRYDRYRRGTDFIQRYIFPGGCLPSYASMREAIKQATDLRATHVEDFGDHYARTLRAWRERFNENLDAIKQLGVDGEFMRAWEYYFCYCEGGFTERQIGVSQMILAKPDSRHDAVLNV